MVRRPPPQGKGLSAGTSACAAGASVIAAWASSIILGFRYDSRRLFCSEARPRRLRGRARASRSRFTAAVRGVVPSSAGGLAAVLASVVLRLRISVVASHRDSGEPNGRQSPLLDTVYASPSEVPKPPQQIGHRERARSSLSIKGTARSFVAPAFAGPNQSERARERNCRASHRQSRRRAIRRRST